MTAAAAVPAPPPPAQRKVPTRRNTELFLLLFAMAVVALAYVNVSWATSGAVTLDGAPYVAGVAVLCLVAHVVVRKAAPYADPVILPVVALLNGLGLVLIHRIHLATEGGRNESPEASTQLQWTAVAIVAFVATLLLLRDHRVLQRYRYVSLVAALVLLLLPMVAGTEINGARIWIRVGGLSFQPAEVAKILLLVFFAAYLVEKRDVLALASRRIAGIDFPRARDMGPVLVAWLATLAVLVFQRDLGTSLLLFGIFVVMLYVATERTSWVLIGLALFAAGAYVAYLQFGHVARRIDVWLHPFDPALRDASHQLRQALYGFGHGGIGGTGLGEGHPDLVPFAYSDFILAGVGEELGLAGLMAVILLFGLLVARGFRTALAVRDGFGKLFAAGLSFIVVWQLFIVAGGVTGLIPLTGLTTPFMSYGGSSLLANWVIVALLLRISHAARRPATPAAPSDPEGPVVPELLDAPTQVVRR